MSEQRHKLRTFIAFVAVLLIGGVIGWVSHTPVPSKSPDGFRKSPPVLADVFVTWDIPEQAVVGKDYKIDLNLQELQGNDRVVTTLSIEGFMLARALNNAGTEPPFDRSTGNIGDGWIDYQFQLPLGAFQNTTISVYGKTARAGPAFGEIEVVFKNNQSVRIPISFVIEGE